jgi:hypothetical protein
MAELTKEINIEGFGTYRIKRPTVLVAAKTLDMERRMQGASPEELQFTRRTILVLCCLIDAEGKRVYADADFSALMEMDQELFKGLADQIEVFAATPQGSVPDPKNS